MAFNLHAICIPKETLSTIVGPGRCGDNELVTASLINVQLCVVHIMFLKYQLHVLTKHGNLLMQSHLGVSQLALLTRSENAPQSHHTLCLQPATKALSTSQAGHCSLCSQGDTLYIHS